MKEVFRPFVVDIKPGGRRGSVHAYLVVFPSEPHGVQAEEDAESAMSANKSSDKQASS